MTNTFERVRGVIVEVMSVSPERVCPHTDVAKDLGPDSLEVVEMVMGLESEFGVDFGDESVDFGTVSDIVGRMDAVLADRESRYH
jgi:acyl carrier protein